MCQHVSTCRLPSSGLIITENRIYLRYKSWQWHHMMIRTIDVIWWHIKWCHQTLWSFDVTDSNVVSLVIKIQGTISYLPTKSKISNNAYRYHDRTILYKAMVEKISVKSSLKIDSYWNGNFPFIIPVVDVCC